MHVPVMHACAFHVTRSHRFQQQGYLVAAGLDELQVRGPVLARAWVCAKTAETTPERVEGPLRLRPHTTMHGHLGLGWL